MIGVLEFNRELHQYRLDGQIVPSVTTILHATGVSVDFDELSGMSHRLGLAIDAKRAVGQALHADAHAFDDHDLDESTVDPRVRPYLDALIAFRAQSGLIPLRRERRVVHPVLRYAGTMDGIFVKDASTSVLLDIKCGNPDDAGAAYQLAAYQLAHECEPDHTEIHERWSVQLLPGRRFPYRIVRYDDWRDFDVWKAIVATYYAQAARRRDR
jgi:hypothetical protein